MDQFIDYMTTKRGMAERCAGDRSGGNPFAQSRARLIAAIGALLEAARRRRHVRATSSPATCWPACSGVSLAAGEPASASRPGGCSTCSWTGCVISRGLPPAQP